MAEAGEGGTGEQAGCIPKGAQLGEKVSASFMYSVARFNAWVSACGWHSGKEMSEAKTETIKYFVDEYRKMLEENMDDYISNFESYMRINEDDA